MAKQFLFHEDAREALRRGLDGLAGAVRVTLGPRGRQVAIGRVNGVPSLTNDGAAIAREIELPDPFENLGVRLGREAGTRTQEVAGDGTTTALVLTQALVNAGLGALAAGANPNALRRGMEMGAAAVVEDIARGARALEGFSAVSRVATLAAGDDPTLGGLIAEAVEQAGPDGVLSVEMGRGLTSTLERVEGLRLDRGYLSSYFVTDPERMEAAHSGCRVLLFDGAVRTLDVLVPVLEQVAAEGSPLLVMAAEVGEEVLSALVVNRLRGTLDVVAIGIPESGERRRDLLEDIAVLTGATPFLESAGQTLEGAGIENLGRVERVVVESDRTTLLGAGGPGEAMRELVARLRRERDRTEGEERRRCETRLARLTGGAAVIRTGASTEIEMDRLRDRAEDAVAATRAAVEEGVVPGGGVVLLRAASRLDRVGLTGDRKLGVDVLGRALCAPLAQIAANAGLDGAAVVERVRAARPASAGLNAATLEFEDLEAAGVLDPAKVVRVGLQNAVSIAGLILSTDSLVADFDDPEA